MCSVDDHLVRYLQYRVRKSLSLEPGDWNYVSSDGKTLAAQFVWEYRKGDYTSLSDCALSLIEYLEQKYGLERHDHQWGYGRAAGSQGEV